MRHSKRIFYEEIYNHLEEFFILSQRTLWLLIIFCQTGFQSFGLIPPALRTPVQSCLINWSLNYYCVCVIFFFFFFKLPVQIDGVFKVKFMKADKGSCYFPQGQGFLFAGFFLGADPRTSEPPLAITYL